MYVHGLVCVEQRVSLCFGHLFSFKNRNILIDFTYIQVFFITTEIIKTFILFVVYTVLCILYHFNTLMLWILCSNYYCLTLSHRYIFLSYSNVIFIFMLIKCVFHYSRHTDCSVSVCPSILIFLSRL